MVDRELAFLPEMLEEHGLELPDDAQEALGWLKAHKGTVMEEDVSLCHHDFHPLNIMIDDDERVAVLDWPGAALGDRHSDVASTLVLLRTAPMDPPSLIERFLMRFGRDAFCWGYLRRYRQQLPIDPERLRYWEAFRAFVWWVAVLALESGNPLAEAVKPDTAEKIPAGHLERMQQYFWQRARG
jgi:aminoglycoside phosphotransferase (APT) family kinase protein